jgi:hypothetical protein
MSAEKSFVEKLQKQSKDIIEIERNKAKEIKKRVEFFQHFAFTI